MPFRDQVTGIREEASLLFPKPVAVWGKWAGGGWSEVQADLAVLDVVCRGLEEASGLLSVPFAIGIKSKILERLGGVVQGHGGLDLIEGWHLGILVFALPTVNEVIWQQSRERDLTLLLFLLVSLYQFCVPIKEIITLNKKHIWAFVSVLIFALFTEWWSGYKWLFCCWLELLFVVIRFHRLETSWFVKFGDDLKIAKINRHSNIKFALALTGFLGRLKWLTACCCLGASCCCSGLMLRVWPGGGAANPCPRTIELRRIFEWTRLK